MRQNESILAITRDTEAPVMQGTSGNVQSETFANTPSNEAIRPFKVNFPEEDLVDLKRRILSTRWPEKELVNDQTQGVPLATLKALAKYWATAYDWRKVEARLNSHPNFITKI